MAERDSGDSNMMDDAGSSTGPVVESYPILVPKDHNKKLSIMRFNASLGIDFTNWTEPKLERENNEIQYDSRKKYKPEEQPWLLEYGGTDGKKLRGVREGGVMENASYYMLTPSGTNGSFDAFPVSEWYNFHPVQGYKALDYEEAEEKFKARNKAYNKFKVMMPKRMKESEGNDEEDDSNDEEDSGKSKGKKKKGPKDSRYGDDDIDEDEMTGSSGKR